MDMSNGEKLAAANDNSIEAPKETVRVLDRAGLMARGVEILGLQTNALEVGQSLDKKGTVEARKPLLASLFKALEGPHPKKLVLVTEIEGKITGCMIVDRGEQARVENLFLAEGQNQSSVINSLVNTALAELKHGPYTHGPKLHLPANPTSRSGALDQYVKMIGNMRSELVIESGEANDKEHPQQDGLKMAA